MVGGRLEAAGGSFRNDFEAARALTSEIDHDIDRLFVIRFPDRAARDRFFKSSQYVETRARLFGKAAAAMPIPAEYAA